MKQSNLKLISSKTIASLKDSRSKRRTGLLILDVAESLLKHNEYCTLSEISKIMKHAGVVVRNDFILCSFCGRPYWLDCQTKRIYKW